MQVLVRQEDTPVWRVRLAPGPGEEDVALDGPGLAALSAVLAQARASGCRVLVLDSAGPSFCRGMDLAKLVKLTPSEAEPALAGYARAIHELATFPGITAAIVAADAVGGGVGLAAAVDLVLATDAARFSLPELLWGLVPGMVIPPLAARIGARAAQRLALTGATLDVDAALGLGLVDGRLAGDVEKALRARLRDLLRRSPAAVVRLKELVRSLADRPLPEALERGLARTRDDIADEATRAAIGGFLDGEAPHWFAKVPREEAAS